MQATVSGGWRRTAALPPALAVAAVVCGALLTPLVAEIAAEAAPGPERGVVEALVAVGVGWSFLACGLLAWRARPRLPLGPLMVAIGIAWFVHVLEDAEDRVLAAVGESLTAAYLVGFVILVLSLPGGRLATRLDRGLAGAAVVLGLLVTPFTLLPGTEWLLAAQRVIGAALSVVTAVLLVARARRLPAARRAAMAPVLLAAGALFAALAVTAVDDAVDEPLGGAADLTLALVFAAFPVAVLALLARDRLARAAVARAVVEVDALGPEGDIGAALAGALGDPGLEVVAWSRARDAYVDRDGAVVALPGPDSGRSAILVQREDGPLAAILHGGGVLDDPAVADAARATAALVLDRARLAAELEVRLAELAASRERIAEAADRERRRIERDLHDGLQQRLVAVAMRLGLAAAIGERDPARGAEVVETARRDLEAAIEGLRELANGILPAALAERGLAAALADLRDGAPVPVVLHVALEHGCPPPVEAAAYFVVSEGITNAAKHAGPGTVRVAARTEGGRLVVEVRDEGPGGADPRGGSGLRGLRDRVEALGGSFEVSARGTGTTLTARLPCGS